MKTITKLLSSLLIVMIISPSVLADDSKNTGSDALKSLFESIGGNSGSLGKVGDVIQNLVATDKLEISDLVGTWCYSAPAVAFKSENLLKQAGGAAVASSLEDKLQTYYKMARIQSMKLVVSEDSTFTMTFNRVALKGNITRDTKGNFFFNYTAAGKIKIGTIQTYLAKSGNTLNVMYDVSKLISLINKVGSYTGNSTIKGISSLLNGYDGITAGFKLKKQ